GTCEQNGTRMELLVLSLVGKRPRPSILGEQAIEVEIGSEATADLDERGSGGIITKNIVLGTSQKAVIQVVDAILGAASAFEVDRIAILEVPDFIGERYVVGVGCPGHPGVLT